MNNTKDIEVIPLEIDNEVVELDIDDSVVELDIDDELLNECTEALLKIRNERKNKAA